MKRGGVRKRRRKTSVTRKGSTGYPKSRYQNRRTGGYIGVEKKFFDTELDDTAFTAAWTALEPATTNLTAIAQGDGESSRDGREYAIDSIHIRGYVTRDLQESQTAPASDILVRVCLVWDTQTNGAQLTATQVMDGSQTQDVFAFRNLQYTKRFRVLKDLTIKLNVAPAVVNEGAANLFASGYIIRPFKINKVFKNPIRVIMSGTAADIANVTDNSLHIIGVSTNATATSLHYQCRVRFRG